MNEIEQLREWIHDSDNIVFFGGAGVSTESNIPDFRSVDGFTIKNMTILRKRSSVIPFLCGILRNFTVFTAIK